MRAPLFWQDDSFLSKLLSPVAKIYGNASQRRRQTPTRIDIPVICIGNLVAGGAGKTPIALALQKLLAPSGKRIFFLSRGYGGALKGPLQVTSAHTAREVGDEALLLAEQAPTVICHKRLRGAEFAMALGAELLILDDGFQNTTLHKDASFLVIDGAYGFGNGKLIPAGPLREPIESGLARAQAVILIGEDKHHIKEKIPASLPLFTANFIPTGTPLPEQTRVIAFAGIGRPVKFYDTLRALNLDPVKLIGFPDHHKYRAADIKNLQAYAKEFDAKLVTTAKDVVRLPESFRPHVHVIGIEAVFDHPEGVKNLLKK